MPDVPVTLDEGIAEIERELKRRTSSYPVRVREGHMNPRFANRQIDRMQFVLDVLKGLRNERGGVDQQPAQ